MSIDIFMFLLCVHAHVMSIFREQGYRHGHRQRDIYGYGHGHGHGQGHETAADKDMDTITHGDE